MPAAGTFAALGVFLSLVLVACGPNTRADQTAEVQSIRDCPAPRCISRQEATRELGFEIWEPTDLPEGFEIYERVIRTPRLDQSPPGVESGASRGGVPPTLTTGGSPKALYLEYRFNRSLNVPALFVVEAALASPGARIALRVRDEGCGEIIGSGGEAMVYLNGAAAVEPGASETEWWACKVEEVPARDSHTVFLARGHVLIEVVAFPQAGVSRDEILRLAQSFVEAE